MSGDSFDVQDEVRDALNTAVDSYGKGVLNDPRVLGNVVTDLLPDHPRERSLLVTAAEAGVAAELTQHVEGQQLDADTAVALVSQSLIQNRALDPAASLWVATEYAKALGYSVRSQMPPVHRVDDNFTPTKSVPPSDPPVDETRRDLPPLPGPGPRPNPGPGPIPDPGPRPRPRPNPGDDDYDYWRARRRRPLLLGGGGVAAVLAAYLIIAAVAHTIPFAKPQPRPTPTPKPGPTTPAPRPTTPSPGPATPAPALPAGVKPLKVLLPLDVQDPSTECYPQTKVQWRSPGLVSAMVCNPPDIPGGNVLAYQMDNVADYQAAWRNYNSAVSFGVSKTIDCPPSSGNSQGGPGEWWEQRFPQRAGQVLECFSSKEGPVYAWTYPTENIFMIAQPPTSWTFSKLDTWWKNNAV